MNTHTLQFAGLHIELVIDEDARVAFQPVLDFVSSHFHSLDGVNSRLGADVVLHILPFEEFAVPSNLGRYSVVRKTRDPAHEIHGSAWSGYDADMLFISASRTAFIFSKQEARACIYVSSTSRYHVSDFIRGVVRELAVNKGYFIHAAAVTNSKGEATAIVGPKRAGKTTTAIDFCLAGASYFSGDLLYISNDCPEICYSWPDYPYIGWGTIRSCPKLLKVVSGLGMKEKEDTVKEIFPHDFMSTAFGTHQAQSPAPLTTIVVPNILGLDEEPKLEPISPNYSLLEPHEKTYWSVEGEGWHPFFMTIVNGSRMKGNVRRLSHDLHWFARRGRKKLGDMQIEKVLSVTSGVQ